MNKHSKKHFKTATPRLKWLWILLIQLVSMFAISALLSLSIWLGGFIHGLCNWVLIPVAGFTSACLATRKGLLNYAAWIAPPVMQVFASLVLWGYSPAIGPVFICGFISLVGAATGEVLKRQYRR